MLDETFFAELVQWVLAEAPNALAIVLHGSYARGEAGPYSDVDLDVIQGDPATKRYHTLLLEREPGRLLHVSIGFQVWSAWQQKQYSPARWSFSLPVRQPIRVLWAAPGMDHRQIEVSYTQPADSMEVEDFLECASKVKNAYLAGDELGVRMAAQHLAQLCPSLLRSLNDPPPIRTQREALSAVLEFSVAPPHYREDMLVCLGFAGQATTMRDVYQSVLRLARGVFDLLQSQPEAILDDSPNIPRYIKDGTIKRYLSQE